MKIIKLESYEDLTPLDLEKSNIFCINNEIYKMLKRTYKEPCSKSCCFSPFSDRSGACSSIDDKICHKYYFILAYPIDILLGELNNE